MIRFECDYATGAHPQVLQALVDTNGMATPGYGEDPCCEKARRTIRDLCRAPEAMVQFLPGGTQANLTVIAAALRPYQGTVCADTGHINCHETGAIEATGHKVLALPGRDGKITAEQVDAFCRKHFDDLTAEHIVQPGMIYLSQPTEVGTVYTLAELEQMRQTADRWGLKLFVDGARLACALAASDVTLPDLARLCHVFYIGGTKCGALFGEAVVIIDPQLKVGFRSMIKRQGGMFAKGRLLGVQFSALLEDGLYFRLGQKMVEQAMALRGAFRQLGYPVLVDSPTNQQFPILPDRVLEGLKDKYSCSFWEKVDEEHTAVRFCTAWSTKDEEIQALTADLKRLK